MRAVGGYKQWIIPGVLPKYGSGEIGALLPAPARPQQSFPHHWLKLCKCDRTRNPVP